VDWQPCGTGIPRRLIEYNLFTRSLVGVISYYN